MNDETQDSDPNDFKRFPSILYHYYSLEDIRKFDVFKNKIIWRSSPASFNDPFDCKIAVSFELFSTEQLKIYITNTLKRNFPNASRNFYRIQTKHIMKDRTGYIRDLKDAYMKSTNLHSGFTCFSFSNRNIQLWAYYTKNHEGICLGFDSSEICRISLFGFGGTVQYVDKIPVVKPSLSVEENHTNTNLLFLYKDVKWKHEEEFRLIKNFPDAYDINDPRRGVQIDPKVLKEVIFGYRVDSLTREEMITEIKREFSHVQFFEARLDNQNFSMKIIPLKQSPNMNDTNEL